MELSDVGNPFQSSFPVLNEHVVGHIISYLKLNDLKSCRLVNFTWMTAARKQYKKKGSITEGLIRTLCSLAAEQTHVSNLLSNIGRFGFQNFSIDFRIFLQSHIAEHVFNNFITVFATNIRRVTLKTNLQSLSDLFFFIDYFSKLESLKIILTDFTTVGTAFEYALKYKEHGSIKKLCIEVEGTYEVIENRELISKYQTFFLMLLQKCINLESLEFLNSPRCNQVDHNNINLLLRILNRVIMENPKLNISQKLRDLIFTRYGEEWGYYDFAVFHKIQIKFQKLFLPDYVPFRCAEDAFHCGTQLMFLIHCQRQSLVQLSIKLPTTSFVQPKYHLISNNFPTFPALKKLEIEICFKSDQDYSVLNFLPITYDIQLPMLEELIITISCSDNGIEKALASTSQFLIPFLGDNLQVCKSLQRLNILVPYKWTIGGGEAPNYMKNLVQNLTVMFPNVNNHARINEFRSNFL